MHLRNSFIDARAKNQIERARRIKHMIDQEHNVGMWYLIQRTVKDPSSPAVLKVQTIKNVKIPTYTKQADIEQVIQKQCEYRFTLAHRAPTMKHALGVKLRYLSDEEMARSITERMYNIHIDLDNAIKLILEEIGKMGTEIRNKEGQDIVITPEYFIRFWE